MKKFVIAFRHTRSQRLRERLNTLWNNAWVAYILLTVAGAFSGKFLQHTPAPGYAIAFLAFVAAIISVRDNSPLQKFVWLILLGVLLRVEFKAIRIDRDAAAREQSERFAAQQREFSRIATKIDTSIADNDQRFGQAAGKAQSILEAANQSETLAGNALSEMTGADSYPYVSPQTQVNNPSVIPLAIWNGGKNMLTNVAVTIHRNTDYTAGDDIAFEMKEENIVGVVHNAWPRILKETISPHLDPGADVDGYTLTIYTQKNLYSESLQFRRAQSGRGWLGTFYVSRQMTKVTIHQQGKTIHGTGSSLVCRSHGWPDENDPKAKALLSKVPFCGNR